MRSPVWHPFTQHALTPEFPVVSRGEGVWLETDKGRLLDAISSWWVITHGHRHPRIVAAIKAQADQLDQAIFANLTHQPAEDVARVIHDKTNIPVESVTQDESEKLLQLEELQEAME